MGFGILVMTSIWSIVFDTPIFLNYGSLSWFWRCKEYQYPFGPCLGIWRMLDVPDWGLASWSWFGYGQWSFLHTCFEFRLCILILKVQEHICQLSPDLGLWRILEDPDWGLASWSWFGYGHQSLIHPCFKFGLDILIFKVQTTSMSFESPFGAFEDALSSWLGFGMLILVWIWSMFFDISIFVSLAILNWSCREHSCP